LDNNKTEKAAISKLRPKNRLPVNLRSGRILAGLFILKTVSGVAVPKSIRDELRFLFIVASDRFSLYPMCAGSRFYRQGCAENEKLLFRGIYGLGKIVSYTVIGGIFGWLGSIIAFTR